MSELMRNPRAMKKAQDEVRQIGNRKNITESDLLGLDYLNLVLKETLRLHPVAPLIPRVCQQTFKVSDYDIPKGTNVVVNLWVIGTLINLIILIILF
jgi:cytochrome P450